MNFFERLKLELEDLREELVGLASGRIDYRVGDFGCGWGYTTLGLMLELHVAESIGIDKFMGNFLSPSFQDVQHLFDTVREITIKESDKSPYDDLKGDIRRLLSKGRYPVFQKNDIVKGSKLPSELDLVYCKRLLGNIYTGEYNNSLKGDHAVSIAIANIVNTLKIGGLVCLVEKDSIYFAPFLEKADLKLVRICRICHNEIEESGRSTSSFKIGQYFVYQYRKI